MSNYQILMQTAPPTRRPYRVIENVCTSDGPRSRIVGGAFETQREAEEDIEARIKRQGE